MKAMRRIEKTDAKMDKKRTDLNELKKQLNEKTSKLSALWKAATRV